jgi:hypothetical protein
MRGETLFPDTKVGENLVQNILNVYTAGQAAERGSGLPQILCS